MKFKPNIVLILSAALLTTGCSVFPEYIKTAIKMPDSWQAKLLKESPAKDTLPKDPLSKNKLPHNGNVSQLIDW